eukprot:6855487-Pyramimonas_sp.AAC.1
MSLSMLPVVWLSAVASRMSRHCTQCASLHHLSHPTDVTQQRALNRFLPVFASQRLADIFSTDGHSDLNAQAAPFKYILQLSGRRRPRVELAKSDDRGIGVLQ